MAIVKCPQCQKSISDKHSQCPHCQLQLDAVDEQTKQAIARQNKIKKQQGLMNQSFVALILFLAGFFVLYWQQPPQGSTLSKACYGAVGVGVVWYLVNRVRIILLKRSK